jgi:hypothetical protein
VRRGVFFFFSQQGDMAESQLEGRKIYTAFAAVATFSNTEDEIVQV